MARLPRPYIPLSVKLVVSAFMLFRRGFTFVDFVCKDGETRASLLARRLAMLAPLLNCSVKDLRLDHDPALVNRKKIRRGGVIVGYRPAANDPNFLIYRTAHAHDIKTRVRGDGAQFSDLALARRERRRQKRKQSRRPKKRWASRPFPKKPA